VTNNPEEHDDAFGDRVDPRRYLAVLRRRWLALFLGGAAVLVLVAVWTVTTAPTYVSDVDVLVRGSPSSVASVIDRVGTPSLETEVQLVQSPDVLEAAEAEVGADWGDVSGIGARQLDGTSIIRIDAAARTAETAAAAAQATADAYLGMKAAEAQDRFARISVGLEEQIQTTRGRLAELDAQIVAAPVDPGTGTSLQQSLLLGQRQTLSTYLLQLEQQLEQLRIDTALQTEVLQIVARAEVPPAAASPNRTQNAILGIILAAIIGIGVALARDYFDDQIHSVADLEAAAPFVPLLATIPRLDARTQGGVVGLIRPTEPAAESYRRLRTNIQFVALHEDIKTILVTSAAVGDGKSTTAANLAATISLTDQVVALVDADLRRPSQSEIFLGVQTTARGLSSLLLGRSTVKAATQQLSPFGERPVRLIPSGPVPPNPAELLGGPALDKVLSELGSLVDVIVIDGPPLLPVTDSQLLAARVDGVVLVVRAGATSRRDLATALSLVHRSGAHLLGVALNDTHVERSSYHYGAMPADA
jgi:capsular exopolysaccharide synthesis family protein